MHGRTRACAYRGEAEYATIRDIKLAVTIPVFANGDIDNPLKAEDVLKSTGADAVMIGRAVRGRPWLLRQVDEYLNTKNHYATRPVARSNVILFATTLKASIVTTAKKIGVRVARKHLAWYAENLDDGADSAGWQCQPKRPVRRCE